MDEPVYLYSLFYRANGVFVGTYSAESLESMDADALAEYFIVPQSPAYEGD